MSALPCALAAHTPGLAQTPALTLQTPQGRHQIALHDQQGHKVVIAHVDFLPLSEGGARFELKIDHKPFSDHFLSMREMKCLSGGTELLCHIPYPYKHAGVVRSNDYAWLEHSLLFMFKKPADFGAKLWNGVYFELRRTAQGLEGKPQAVDLNQIAATPTRLDLPPFRKALRDDMPAAARWFNKLSIEP